MSQELAESDNTVFIGSKPAMSYVFAVITQFNRGEIRVHIKARGKSISRAVDVAEILKSHFNNSLKVKNISIGTDELTNSRGILSKVSNISIDVEKPAKK